MHWGAAFGIGLLLCAATVGSSWFDLGTSLPGVYNDDWANGVYLHHQVHQAILDGRFDLADPSQFFPVGYNPVHSNGGNILEMLVSGVFRLVLPWPYWLSVAALAWIPLNLLAFIPLGRRVFDRPSVVLAAASTWAVFPPVLDHIGAGRLTQAALVGLPIAVAGLLDVAEGGGRRARWLAAAGWALTGLGYWYNAFFLGVLLPIFWWCLRSTVGGGVLARELGRVGGMALAMVAPFLTVVFWPVLSGGAMPGSHIDPNQMNIVFPDALHLIGGQAQGLANWLPYSMMIGIVVFAFAGRRRALWGMLSVAGVVFALGPGQDIGGSAVPMPYWVLWKSIPGLSGMFHPDRWMLVAGLFLSIAAVDGLARRLPWAAWLVPMGVMVQLWVRGDAPFGTWTPTVPAHWQALTSDPTEGAVIVIPMDYGQLAGQYQWIHGRSLLGGMIEDQPWRHPAEWTAYVRSNAFLLHLRSVSYGQGSPSQPDAEAVADLQRDGFSHIVYDHRSWVQSQRRASTKPLDALLGSLGSPIFASTDGAVWRLTDIVDP